MRSVSTEHPQQAQKIRGRLTVEGPRCQQVEMVHELNEVCVGGIVVPDGYEKVVLHHLHNVGDCVGHDCNSFPFSVHGSEGVRREARGQGKGTKSYRRTGAKRRLGLRDAVRLRATLCDDRIREVPLRMWLAFPEEAG